MSRHTTPNQRRYQKGGNWRESNAMKRDAVEKEKRIPQYGVTWPIQLFSLVTTATSIRLISNIRSQVAYIGEQ